MAAAAAAIAEDAFAGARFRGRQRCCASLSADLAALASGVRSAILLDYPAPADGERALRVASRLRGEAALPDAAAVRVDGEDFVLRSVQETERRAEAAGCAPAVLRVGGGGYSWADAAERDRVDEVRRNTFPCFFLLACARELSGRCSGAARGKSALR